MVHFTFYFVLVILMNYGWRKQTTFTALHRHTWLVIFIIACVYGYSIEIMQEAFTTTRHYELLDEVANACGAGLGSIFAVKLFKRIDVK
jgi:VanZ family protein